MVIFEQTLRQLLIESNLVAGRVFLMRSPQAPAPLADPPYIVFFPVAPIDQQGTETHGGPLNVITRLYQMSIFDNSQSRALAIADSLRMYLDGWRGDYLNCHIGHIFPVTQSIGDETDTRLFQVIAEYRIMFRFISYDPPAVPTRTTNRNKQEQQR